MAVNPDMIAVGLGRTAPDWDSIEYQQWDMWISDALMLIEDRLGDPAELDQAKLDYVVREAVVAHVRRPDDATQVDIASDDSRLSRRYTSGKGRVTILDEWWDLLSPQQYGGAFSIDTLCVDSLHMPWCSLSLGATFCSCGVDVAGYPIYEVG